MGHDVGVDEAAHDHSVDGTQRPDGFLYRPFRLFGRELWYASPKIQLLMVSVVCFLCPGMYNSLTGLGGGGQVDTTVQDHANIALYSTFAVVGFFAGTFANRLGLRLTLSIGGLGYCIYSASFLSYSHTQNVGFVIFSGAFLGLCAALLWTAQGAIMMSYPPENSKGRYISWFWIIFNLGAVIGSLVRAPPCGLAPQPLMRLFRSPSRKTSTRRPALSPTAPTSPSSSLCLPAPACPSCSATRARWCERTRQRSSS